MSVKRVIFNSLRCAVRVRRTSDLSSTVTGVEYASSAVTSSGSNPGSLSGCPGHSLILGSDDCKLTRLVAARSPYAEGRNAVTKLFHVAGSLSVLFKLARRLPKSPALLALAICAELSAENRTPPPAIVE